MRCDTPVVQWPDALPGSKLPYGLDFTPQLARWLARGREYSQGTFVRVFGVPGREYEVTTAGQTGQRQPRFPTTVAGTVTDGSCVLTCRQISVNSLLTTVSTVAWSAESGVTVSGEALYGQIATASLEVGAGVSDDTDIVVTVTATLADGNILIGRAVLPVRIPPLACAC